MQISPPVRILLFEDDIDDCMFFKDALTETGLNTILKISNSCANVASRMVADDGTLWPDIIFLDLNMPQVTGQECLQMIRDNEEYHPIPVVIYSTSSLKSELDNTFELGANLYLQKPSSFNLLVIALKRILTMDWKSKMESRDRASYQYKHLQDPLIA